MKGGKRPLGYTIIEVMIVLAVSGVMFVIAASFISGKEASSAFTEGSNEFSSQLQQIVSQVADGQYTDVNLNCTVAIPGNTLTFTDGDSDQSLQGTNAACDFLGKFVHFQESSDKTSYEVFSLAGARTDDTLVSATPIVGNGIDLTTQQTTPQALNVVDVKVTDASGTTHTSDGIGFVQSQATCDAADSCVSGSQIVSMVYAPGLDAPAGSSMGETAAKNAITGNLTPAAAAVICLSDGTRYAKIALGDSTNLSSPLNVTLQYINPPFGVTPPC
jgi:prepilin-type N-terminal cleavage/methylation domain-containing protein